jgi:hypothetical protein
MIQLTKYEKAKVNVTMICDDTVKEKEVILPCYIKVQT